MFFSILLCFIISLLFIMLIHYLYIFLIKMFTTPKIKDLYNKPLDRYEELITSYNSKNSNEKKK